MFYDFKVICWITPNQYLQATMLMYVTKNRICNVSVYMRPITKRYGKLGLLPSGCLENYLINCVIHYLVFSFYTKLTFSVLNAILSCLYTYTDILQKYQKVKQNVNAWGKELLLGLTLTFSAGEQRFINIFCKKRRSHIHVRCTRAKTCR